MANFGWDSLTGFAYAGHNWPLANTIQTNRVQVTEQAHVTKLVTYFYLDGAGPLTIPTQHCRAVIYADDGMTVGGYVAGNIGVVPGTFLRGGPETTGFTRQAWNDLPLDSPIDLAPGYYWIGISSDNSADGLTADGFNRYETYTYQPTASFPPYFDNGGGTGTGGDVYRPIYGVYTISGGPVALTAIGSGISRGSASPSLSQAVSGAGVGRHSGVATLGLTLAVAAAAAGLSAGSAALRQGLPTAATGAGREAGVVSLQMAQPVAAIAIGVEVGQATAATTIAIVASATSSNQSSATLTVTASGYLPSTIGYGAEVGSATLSMAQALGASAAGFERGGAGLAIYAALVAGSAGGEVGSASLSVRTASGANVRATIALIAHAYPALALTAQSRPALALTAEAYPPISLRVED